MSKESHILLENITAEAELGIYSYSNKAKGAGYHRKFDTLTTVVYSVEDFIGSIKMQGTLEMYPGEGDWVDISGTEIGSNNDSSVWTSAQSINFTGNWLWIRSAYSLQNGTIQQIRYNH